VYNDILSVWVEIISPSLLSALEVNWEYQYLIFMLVLFCYIPLVFCRNICYSKFKIWVCLNSFYFYFLMNLCFWQTQNQFLSLVYFYFVINFFRTYFYSNKLKFEFSGRNFGCTFFWANLSTTT